MLSNLGRHEEAIKEAQTALQLDSLSPTMIRDLGAVYLFSRQFDKAIIELQRSIALNPDSLFGHWWLLFACQQKNMYEDSIRVIVKLADLFVYGDRGTSIERTYAESGYDAALQQFIPMVPDPYHKATLFAFLDDKEKAFERLENAYEERNTEICGHKVDPTFERMHADPRFKAMLKKLNLE